MKRIFGIGTVVIDHVMMLANYPVRDTKVGIESHWRQIGGPVPVALSTAANYGANACFCGRWGEDDGGQQIRSGLTKRGIDLQPSISEEAWVTGFAHVWAESASGTRTIAYCRGDFPQARHDPEAQLEQLADCQLLHLDGAHPDIAFAAAERFRQTDGLTILDAGSRKPGMEKLLPLVDIIVASDLFAKSWFGTSQVNAAEIRRLGPQIVVQTMGRHGASYDDGVSRFRSPAIDVDVLDSNGAGDVFCGGLLFGLANGWAPERVMSFACFVAGHSCQHYGNSTWPDLRDFIA